MNLKEGYKEKRKEETKRYCQFLKLNPETIEQYKYWHNSANIWKEIPEGIRNVGILDMEIYTVNDIAFMVIETQIDFKWDEAFRKLASLDRQCEWEEFVSKFQIAENGKRSDEKWQLMERIFSLDEALSTTKSQ